MSSIQCRGCGIPKGSNSQHYKSNNCKHIFCKSCLTKTGGTQCVVCRQPATFILIQDSLAASVEAFFEEHNRPLVDELNFIEENLGLIPQYENLKREIIELHDTNKRINRAYNKEVDLIRKLKHAIRDMKENRDTSPKFGSSKSLHGSNWSLSESFKSFELGSDISLFSLDSNRSRSFNRSEDDSGFASGVRHRLSRSLPDQNSEQMPTHRGGPQISVGLSRQPPIQRSLHQSYTNQMQPSTSSLFGSTDRIQQNVQQKPTNRGGPQISLGLPRQPPIQRNLQQNYANQMQPSASRQSSVLGYPYPVQQNGQQRPSNTAGPLITLGIPRQPPIQRNLQQNYTNQMQPSTSRSIESAIQHRLSRSLPDQIPVQRGRTNIAGPLITLGIPRKPPIQRSSLQQNYANQMQPSTSRQHNLPEEQGATGFAIESDFPLYQRSFFSQEK